MNAITKARECSELSLHCLIAIHEGNKPKALRIFNQIKSRRAELEKILMREELMDAAYGSLTPSEFGRGMEPKNKALQNSVRQNYAVWRNGKRNRLKTCLNVGSSPTTATNIIEFSSFMLFAIMLYVIFCGFIPAVIGG